MKMALEHALVPLILRSTDVFSTRRPYSCSRRVLATFGRELGNRSCMGCMFD